MTPIGPSSRGELWVLILRSFLPPIFLIALVLGSIFAGFATPTEAAGVGALGATLLAIVNRKLNFSVLKDVVERTALTNAMIFGIFVGTYSSIFVAAPVLILFKLRPGQVTMTRASTMVCIWTGIVESTVGYATLA